MFANMASQSVEVIEAEQPIEILSYEFLTDRAGAGKYRGGAPYCREYRFTEKEAILQVRSDRRAIKPYGLYGGRPGKSSMNYMNPDSDNQPLPSKLTMTIHTGDVFRHELAGGGGWGDPFTRDPDAVLQDVRNELVSGATARDDYGVVVNTNTWTVDTVETDALRAQRKDPEIQKVVWE